MVDRVARGFLLVINTATGLLGVLRDAETEVGRAKYYSVANLYVSEND